MGTDHFGDDFKRDAIVQIIERAILLRRFRSGSGSKPQGGTSIHSHEKRGTGIINDEFAIAGLSGAGCALQAPLDRQSVSRLGGHGLVIKGTGLELLDPDADQVARQIASSSEAVECLAR